MLCTIRGFAVVGAASLVSMSATAQISQQNQQQMGFADLTERLGDAMPTGASLAVGQVEGKKDQYGPSQSNAEFIDKTLVAMSGNPGTSLHATTVGKNYYGLLSSMSHSVPTIYMWYPMDWVTGYLKSSSVSTLPPDAPPSGLVVFNHSWALNGGINFNNLALRRADFVMDVYGVLMVAGTVNPPKAFEPLMAGTFNGISVGLSNGNHVPGPVPALHDGAGRSKPEIVAPSNLTSYATPIVSAAVNLLSETATSLPRLAGEPSAQRPEVIKASLMAGATHREGWSNGAPLDGPERGFTSTPLDPVYGVDQVHVDRAHWIHGGGLQPGASDPEGAPSVTRTGWDYATVFSGSSRWYRLDVPMEAQFVSILAAWNRVVDDSFASWTVADFELHLWRVNPRGNLVSLVGDEGIAWYESGNAVSASAVDNVEHLYLRHLQPGQYMIELRRNDDGPVAEVALAWYRATDAVVGDIDEDGEICGSDVGTLLVDWGSTANDGDLNGDGNVDGSDLATLLNNWFASW